jgi:hypothetical protein
MKLLPDYICISAGFYLFDLYLKYFSTNCLNVPLPPEEPRNFMTEA